ncbi:hypothetical protein [Roseovarius aestuarii]|nr:hypothetical protein [Roseovarius aestuarii]
MTEVEIMRAYRDKTAAKPVVQSGELTTRMADFQLFLEDTFPAEDM